MFLHPRTPVHFVLTLAVVLQLLLPAALPPPAPTIWTSPPAEQFETLKQGDAFTTPAPPAVVHTAPGLTNLGPEPGPLSRDETAEPALASAVALELVAAPPWAEPGEVITFTVNARNTTDTVLPALTLTDVLPDGLVFVQSGPTDFASDPTTKRLTWSVADLAPRAVISTTFQARLTGVTVGGTVTNTVSAGSPSFSESYAAQATFDVVPPRRDRADGDAAHTTLLRSTDDRVLWNVPPAALAGPGQLSYTARPADRGLFAVFELELTAADAAPPQLAQPARLKVAYRAAEAAQSAGGPRLVRWDAPTEAWQSVTAADDPATRTLSAFVYEGGVYALASGGPTYGVSLLPSLKAFTSELWSGAAGVDYGLDVPSGPAGLGLNLRLAYNSQGANILQHVAGYQYRSQASWVGLGWDLAGLGSISRPLGKAGPYTLSFGGGAFEIKDVGGVLTTDPQGFLQITHSDELAWNTQPWTVRTPDGTQYTFGNPAGTVGGGTAYEAFWTSWGQDCSVRATQWGLTRIEDPAGNRWDIAWDHETKALSNGCGGDAGQYTRASYPATLTLTPKNGTPTVRVRLVRQPRADKNICKYNDAYQVNHYGDGRLQQVYVETSTTGGGTWQLLRRYDLGYTYDPTTLTCGADPGSGNHSWLTAITQYGADGVSALPAHTFTYTGSGNAARLQTANNGYSGQVAYTYATEGVANNAGCTSYQWQVVTQQVAHPGSGANLAAQVPVTTTYTTSGPFAYVTPVGCYNGAEIPRDTYEFLGHTQVQETVLGPGNTAVAERTHKYAFQYDAAAGKPDARKGKETELVVTQPGGAVLAKTETAWLTQTVNGVLWPYVSAVTQTQPSSTTPVGDASTVTRYDYNPAYQGGTQYGNVTHTREYPDPAATTPVRTTLNRYAPNTTAWILNRPATTEVYAGEEDVNKLAASTWYIYSDDQANPGPHWNQPVGSLGQLRGVRRYLRADAQGVRYFADTRYWHDAWGNVIQTRTYTDYGLATAWAITPANTVTIDYDSLFRVYPLTQTSTPDAGGGAVLTTQNFYYGINPDPNGGSGLLGQVQAVQDPNTATTRYSYDAFGRLIAEVRPDDTLALPTTTYAYYDTEQPFRVVTTVRETSGCSGCNQPTVTFYDGLGRVIQTKTESQNGLEMLVTDTRYHALGAVEQQYVPYKRANPVFGDAEFWGFAPLDTTRPKTTTQYDALGRPVAVTQPDGATTETRYTVETIPGDPDAAVPRRVTYTIDPNRRFVRRAADGFGNLRVVSENLGAWPAGQPEPTWGDTYHTYYNYDALDRLVTVTDHAGNATTLTYDLLGRKTQTVDPDMGTWQYGYDARGNLTRQTDAKDQRICFYYDGHNRLKGKTYSAGTTDCPADPGYGGYAVKHYYDTDENSLAVSNGRGRRTVLFDGSGSTRWLYDTRGRTTQETRVISGTGGGVFTTQWTYDALDRLLTQTYPDGELVTTTYTAEGLPKTLSGKNTYVGDTAYTALGQVDQRRLGSTAGVMTTDYIYRSDNFRLQWLKTGVSAPFESLQKLEYAYDPVGNVDWIKDWRAGSPQLQDYTYDALHRLTTAVATGGSSGTYNESYTYNAIGNLTGKTGVGDYGYGPQAPDCPALNRIQPHAVVTAGSNSYCYDQNGNMSRRTVDANTYTLSYDAENRLTGVSGPAVASYVYDGDGQRVQATFGSGDSASITSYLGRQVEISPAYREDFSDGLAQGWTAASGTWTVIGGGYRQSGTGSNTNAYRSQTQNQLLVYQWRATFTSGTSAGPYLLASTATGTHRGNSYRIWQDATHVRIYESANNVATLRASFIAANAAGQTHSYQTSYDPLTGKLQVWRDNLFLGSWTDATPLLSGSYLALRTDGANVLFDDLVVSEMVKYYESGGQRVALRKNGVVSYLFGDHLGSTSVTANASGTRTGELWYKPWGESRGTPVGTTPTTYRYTGQREDGSVQLYFYGARYYDSVLGRFIQADTIVPDAADPFNLNRYSYVGNRPLLYTDPTGHVQACPDGDEGAGCGEGASYGDIYELFSRKDSPLFEYYASKAQLQERTRAGASEAELEGIRGSMEGAHARGSWWIGSANYDPIALVDPGFLSSSAVGITTGGAKALAQAISRVPNPWGRLGGPEHRAMVDQVVQSIEQRGLTAQREYRVPTAGGSKATRWVDVAALDADLQPVELHQVGRISDNGRPIAREHRALNDLFEFGALHATIHYHPYYPR